MDNIWLLYGLYIYMVIIWLMMFNILLHMDFPSLIIHEKIHQDPHFGLSENFVYSGQF